MQQELFLGSVANGYCHIHNEPMRLLGNGDGRMRYECPLCRAAGRTRHKELVARLERGDFEGMTRDGIRVGPQARRLIDPKLLDAYDNYKKEKRKKWNIKRRCHLRLKYDITEEDYERMYEEQGGHCKICGAKKKLLYIDHCHKTGKVRGLLCNHCNTGLGLLKDNVENLRSAIAYLEAA